ncbi:hypothetical protein MLD38_008690 [Melastoma candidum]|uniref:Uncharacterized protein n=1 Tax=Melastoma candidum TaxID=119954 RepID=A0ACB9RWF5_9MYRT|nr:hypothetical protein MLD38_008690 [Melastoma candidum]
MSAFSSEEVRSPRWSLPLLAPLWVFVSFLFRGLRRLFFPSSSSSPFNPIPLVELPVSPPRQIPPSSSSSSAVVIPDSADTPDDLPRLTVVLDLDETLVWACETSSLPASIHKHAVDAGLKWFHLECISTEKDNGGKSKINHMTVFERPGLQEFLGQVCQFADLVLFTAGLEGYAGPLVDRIDAENRFSRRLYRPSTISTEYREHVKDISRLSRDLSRIVIVDNNPFSFLLQPLNGIPCVSFSAAHPRDDQLLVVILPLLKELLRQHDVRSHLRERFQMPQWFQSHGIPASSWS